MTISPQADTLLPMTGPFSERLSETWLLERTYHAQLRNGRELSVPDTTHYTVIAADGQVQEYANRRQGSTGLSDLASARDEQWKPGPNGLPTVLLLSRGQMSERHLPPRVFRTSHG